MRDVRIQKVLAEQGICSRRAAEQLIREGRVKLNGRPVTVGDKMDTLKDLLTVDGQKVYVPKKSEKYYYMMYKPRGYITTTNDERGRKTVMDLIADVPVRVYPVGRLDKDSEGLLLLTNDGDFANLLTHPSHGVSKLYRVTVRPHATEEQIIALTDGVVLDDGSKTLPASIHVVTDEPERTVLEMTIREGKNRQIRRMFPVKCLRRVENRHARLLQHLGNRLMIFVVRGENDEVRLQGEQQLHVRLVVAAQALRAAVAQLLGELEGVLGHADQRSAGGHPRVGIGRVQRNHALRMLHRDLAALRVGERRGHGAHGQQSRQQQGKKGFDFHVSNAPLVNKKRETARFEPSLLIFAKKLRARKEAFPHPFSHGSQPQARAKRPAIWLGTHGSSQ